MESTQISRPARQARKTGMEDLRTAAYHGPDAAEPRDGDGSNGHSVDGHDDWGPIQKASGGWVVLATVLIFLGIAALFATGFIPRVRNNADLKSDAQAELDAPVPVTTVRPTVSPAVVDLPIPGTLRPWQEVSIYARSTGYLKKWHADISSQVKKGDLMAEIDSPEIDQQLRQAEAAVLQMKAAQTRAQSDVQINQVTYNRFLSLKGTSGLTQQEVDQKAADLSSAQANLEAAKANVAAAEANVRRLQELQAYQKITAPFDGVVTGRAYDTGALINADPTSVDVKPMYKIAQNDVLRVFVNVPQSSALAIRKGMDVNVAVRERAGRIFVGKVMGTTNYLDPMNRSLLTEIKVPNAEGALLPGMYVQAVFRITRDKPPLTIPAPALIVNAEGTQVAVVKDNRIHFQKVQVGEDFGNSLEITGGLQGDEQIIATPGEKIVEGAKVRIANAEQPGQPANPGPSPAKAAEAGK